MGRKWVGGTHEDNFEYFREKSCRSKRRFPSEEAARKNRRAMSQSNLRVYACRLCGGYHIGHRGDAGERWYAKKVRAQRKRRGQEE